MLAEVSQYFILPTKCKTYILYMYVDIARPIWLFRCFRITPTMYIWGEQNCHPF